MKPRRFELYNHKLHIMQHQQKHELIKLNFMVNFGEASRVKIYIVYTSMLHPLAAVQTVFGNSKL